MENLRRSSVSESDILAEALELYKLKHLKDHSFSFFYIASIYKQKNVPRWTDGSVIKCNLCRKSPTVPS